MPFDLLQPIRLPNSKRQRMTLDFIMTLPNTRNGNSRITTVVAKLSKMIRPVPRKANINASETAQKF